MKDSPNFVELRQLLLGEGSPGVWLAPDLPVHVLIELSRLLRANKSTYCAVQFSWLDGAEARYRSGLLLASDPAQSEAENRPKPASGSFGDPVALAEERLARKRRKVR